MHNKKLLIIWICIFLVLGVLYVFASGFSENGNSSGIYEEDTSGTDNAYETVSEPVSVDGGTKEEHIYVYVCGYVNNPGVYELLYGARMYEAVDIAGGILAGGCADYLNMAGLVNDGDRIYVPSYDEASGAGGGINNEGKVSGKVNINTADRQELMTLSGIGEAKADAIINYRNEYGRFLAIEDIMKIPGIKENAFSKIKDNICV